MRKVDFFIAGNLKSGTTTYYELLRQHPKIFIPDYKEPKFFCTDFHKESDEHHGKKVNYPLRTLGGYQQLYVNAEEKQLLGDCTPHYTYSKVAAKNIYEYNPYAKILIFLREPIAFLRSLHFDSLHALNEVEEDFLRALELEEARKDGKCIPPKISAPSYLYYSEWIKYKEQIKRYVDLFGRDSVKVIFLKEVIKDEAGVFKEILEFLGVKDKDFKPDYSINKNSSRKLRLGFLFKSLKHSKLWDFIGKVVPVKMYPQLNDLLNKIFFIKAEKPSLPGKSVRELRAKFLTEVASLNKYLNEEGLIDFNLLEYWGYED